MLVTENYQMDKLCEINFITSYGSVKQRLTQFWYIIQFIMYLILSYVLFIYLVHEDYICNDTHEFKSLLERFPIHASVFKLIVRTYVLGNGRSN